jgi:hypothetical protein
MFSAFYKNEKKKKDKELARQFFFWCCFIPVQGVFLCTIFVIYKKKAKEGKGNNNNLSVHSLALYLKSSD